MMPITIILADDHYVVREGLRTLLESQPDFRIIGETGDGLQVVSLVDKLRPQVLVLDLMLPVWFSARVPPRNTAAASCRN
jgi:DNA-binding NarL/FixJ family response regulator